MLVQGLFRRRLEGAVSMTAVKGVGRPNVLPELLLRGGDMVAEGAAEAIFVSHRRRFGNLRTMFVVVVLQDAHGGEHDDIGALQAD